jgi:hypothetical protein
VATVEMTDTIPVLDHGFVRLDDCMADDLSVVNAARVSFAQRSEEMGDGLLASFYDRLGLAILGSWCGIVGRRLDRNSRGCGPHNLRLALETA